MRFFHGFCNSPCLFLDLASFFGGLPLLPTFLTDTGKSDPPIDTPCFIWFGSMSCWIGGRDEEADRMDAVLSLMVVILLDVLSLSLSLADEAILV